MCINADVLSLTDFSRNSSALLDLDVPVPPTKGSDNGSLFVDLLLKPYCTYNISIHLSVFQWMAKVTGAVQKS